MKITMKNSNRKKDMKSITILMFIVTACIWALLLFIKYIVYGISYEELFNDIISNILGILPPIIIFNFAYEYLTKQHIAEEMSDQITKTLMSNPDAIKIFDDTNKLRFIKTTMETIVDEDSLDMTYAVIEPYLTKQYNIKKFFKYAITIRDYCGCSLFPAEKYIKIYENLKFKKLFTDETGLPNEFHVGFFAKNYELDKAMRNQSYIFRETLNIDKAEMDKLTALSAEEKMQFIKNELSLSVFVDYQKCEIKSLEFTESGIDVLFASQHAQEEKCHNIEIAFGIPQLKGHSEFLVSINEPTYSPIIQLSYPENTINVNAYSFMNDGDDSLIENAIHTIGGYEFCIQDKWIYPMSGIVFVIDYDVR